MEGIIMANVTTVILIQKCIDAIPSRQFVVIQSQGVYCRKMRCSTDPATDRPPPLAGHFCIHALLLSARYLTTARHRLRSGESLHGSRLRWSILT